MQIKTLATTCVKKVCNAFVQAFADYEVQINHDQLLQMLKRKGYAPDLSFAAFEEDQIIAFTLNGIGKYKGIQTAYDIGTGTMKDFRGQGLATQIFEYSLPSLKRNKIAQYLLEVLQHNTKAVSVYNKLGFKVSREFNCFIQQTCSIKNILPNSASTCSLKQIGLDNLNDISYFQDFSPSWQNSHDAIARNPDSFIILGAFITIHKPVGYCILEPHTGDIAQIAVAKTKRRKGIASCLLHEAIRLNDCESVKVINADVNCHTITDFLKSKNIRVKGKQYEMIKVL